MITIIKGEEKIVCTKKTFEEQYKSLGYQIASEKKEATKEVASILKEEKKDNKDGEKEEDNKEVKTEEDKINKKYKLDLKKEGK